MTWYGAEGSPIQKKPKKYTTEFHDHRGDN